MVAQIVSFQSDQWRLNACVHLPEGRPQSRIGIVLMLEVTKFGTHGLFRQVADAFAASGFYVLRYDNRGACDSAGDCELTFADRVADACAAARFFKTEYKLDKVLFWGSCMGAASAVHASSLLKGAFKPVGMILCSTLADPVEATLPELNYRKVKFSAYWRQGFVGSNWNRLKAFVSDPGYRANLMASIRSMVRTSLKGNGNLQSTRNEIGRVGPLLAQYDGPTLIIYGDTDPFWTSFTKRVNPGDKLRLSQMKSPPKIHVVVGGGHGFDSMEETSEVIRLSTSWLAAFREGRDVAGPPEEIHAIFASATAV